MRHRLSVLLATRPGRARLGRTPPVKDVARPDQNVTPNLEQSDGMLDGSSSRP